MNKSEFLDTLPMSMMCQQCGGMVRAPGWRLSQAGAGQWMAVNVVQCPVCGFKHMAAAGSNDRAHKDAQAARLKFLKSIAASIHPAVFGQK